jgi:putative membrane protein
VTWLIAAFAGGLAAVWMAVASPLAHLDHQLLTGHMVQHLLLMVIAAPLILLGVRLPERMHWCPPLMFCWLAGSSTVILWHVPVIFALALRSPLWHHLEHASFFMAGIVFWWPVVPSGFGARSWSIPLYLFLATLPCDALSAFLVFWDHVAYPTYASDHQVFGLLPLEDQALAGALMWVTVTFAYMIPALFLTARLLSGERRWDAGTPYSATAMCGPVSSEKIPGAVLAPPISPAGSTRLSKVPPQLSGATAPAACGRRSPR